MNIDKGRMYRVSAVAEMLDVSLLTVYRAVESGDLPVLRFGKAMRVPGQALANWLDKRITVASAQGGEA